MCQIESQESSFIIGRSKSWSKSWYCAQKSYVDYHKVPKFWDARNLCLNLPKIQITRPNLQRVFRQNCANGIANSVDPDQEQSDLGLHCLSRPLCPKT